MIVGRARLLLFAAVALALAFAGSACKTETEPVTTTLIVEGMHCEGCSNAITDALTKVEGIESATADHVSGVTTAVHDPALSSADTLKTTVENLGYKVVSTVTE